MFFKKRPKYLNRKVYLDGYNFDSQVEAGYYSELIQLKKQKAIKNFWVKPRIELMPMFKHLGVTYRSWGIGFIKYFIF